MKNFITKPRLKKDLNINKFDVLLRLLWLYMNNNMFINNLYEKEVSGNVTRHLNYIYAGNQIVDIGLDLNRANPSIFYQMEQNMIRNYLKLHPNAFQIIVP